MAKVLVVDDSALMRKMLCDFLRDLGHIPVPAGTVEEALYLCAAAKPDLVIKDLVMKDTDPASFLAQVRSIKSNLPVVICSTAGRQREIFSALKAGAADFLIKPFCPRDIAALVDRYVI